MPSPRTLRRTLGLVLASALLAAACGGGDGDDPETAAPDGEQPELPACPLEALEAATGPVEVVVWHTQTARPLETLTALVAEYNGSQDKVRVRLESQGADYQEIQRKFNEALPSKQLPAVIVVDDTFTRSMADSGVVLPAQSCFEADGYDLDQLVETARSYYTIDGVLWAGTAGLGNVLLYFNRDHFRLAGLDPDDPPETLAEVREYAETIKAAGVADTPFVHEFGSWKTEFWLTGAGSSIVDNDNGRGSDQTTAGTLEGNEEALELLSWFQDMQDDGLLNPIPSSPGQIDQYLAIATGTSSMLIDTSSAATSIEAFLGGEEVTGVDAAPDDAQGLDLGAGTFPGLTGPGQTQMGGDAWYLMSTTPDEVQAAAWDFVTFMNSTHAQAQNLLGGSYMPWVASANDDPEVVAYYAGERGIAGAWLKLANDLVGAIDPDFPGPLIGPYDEVRDAIEDAFDRMVFGDATPDEALTAAQEAVDAALERYNEGNF
jgi:sn-glycerol 3-phosphate transport system substrate-binding protein